MNHHRQQTTADVFGAIDFSPADDPSAFDDMDEPEDESRDHRVRDAQSEDQTADQGTDGLGNVVPVEMRRLSIPSTWSSSANPYRAVELHCRMEQAERTIQALRDAIADKSFQYSHVIRVAPRKHVRTRARATIAKLNNVIAYHSRIYCHCRAAMVRLGAGDSVLARYQILLKEHVKSSSALLNPNEPGSSRVRLSWIWQSNLPGGSSSSASLRECESVPARFRMALIPFLSTVNRVHWIRARAQRNRWKEEYTLVEYEMQWTVRYYLHCAKGWESRALSSREAGDAGATSYAYRKQNMWIGMAQSADSQFSLVNPGHPRLARVPQQSHSRT